MLAGTKSRMFIKKPIIVEAFQFDYDEEPSWSRPKNIEINSSIS